MSGCFIFPPCRGPCLNISSSFLPVCFFPSITQKGPPCSHWSGPWESVHLFPVCRWLCLHPFFPLFSVLGEETNVKILAGNLWAGNASVFHGSGEKSSSYPGMAYSSPCSPLLDGPLWGGTVGGWLPVPPKCLTPSHVLSLSWPVRAEWRHRSPGGEQWQSARDSHTAGGDLQDSWGK